MENRCQFQAFAGDRIGEAVRPCGGFSDVIDGERTSVGTDEWLWGLAVAWLQVAREVALTLVLWA
jgi:hypothetical protein